MAEQCRIIIRRPAALMNRMRPYQVWVDGEKKAVVANGQAVEMTVAPGNHTVELKINWCSSNTVTVAAGASPTYLKVESGLRYYYYLVAMLVIALGLSFYYRLMHLPKPKWMDPITLVLIIPDLLYLFYYLSLGRKKYLVLTEDDAFSTR